MDYDPLLDTRLDFFKKWDLSFSSQLVIPAYNNYFLILKEMHSQFTAPNMPLTAQFSSNSNYQLSQLVNLLAY